MAACIGFGEVDKRGAEKANGEEEGQKSFRTFYLHRFGLDCTSLQPFLGSEGSKKDMLRNLGLSWVYLVLFPPSSSPSPQLNTESRRYLTGWRRGTSGDSRLWNGGWAAPIWPRRCRRGHVNRTLQLHATAMCGIGTASVIHKQHDKTAEHWLPTLAGLVGCCETSLPGHVA